MQPGRNSAKAAWLSENRRRRRAKTESKLNGAGQWRGGKVRQHRNGGVACLAGSINQYVASSGLVINKTNGGEAGGVTAATWRKNRRLESIEERENIEAAAKNAAAATAKKKKKKNAWRQSEPGGAWHRGKLSG